MQKLLLNLVLALLFLPLCGIDSMIRNNDKLLPQMNDGYMTLQTSDELPIYADKAGDPAIPLTHHFFQIPANCSIESIEIVPLDVKQTILSAPVIPIQKTYPLSYEGTPEFVLPNAVYGQRSMYPTNYLSHFGDGYSGSVHIGYVTYYTAQYEPVSKTLFQPSQFRIEVNYTNDRSDKINRNNVVTNDVLSSLGLDIARAATDTTGYLLIYPASLADAYAPLVEWRKKQGLRVFTQTVEYINSHYGGVDLQANIRFYIRFMYWGENISYVTLGADTEQIPDRKFFAFDCHFGYQADENSIPADMYYANLDGSFDNNQNGIYGEEGLFPMEQPGWYYLEEPDYFPEVYVGRISAHNVEDVTDYVNRLIAYEQGHLPNYNNSVGLVMDLWAGSNSVQCQQYIVEKDFPPYYDNTLLNQEDNNVSNALSAMSWNPNIVQHTGHANQNLMALRHGYINNDFMTQLHNDYGGLFYSIGCWSEAIDYSSIGEKMVMTPGKGMLAFVGNSRFGWGAPIAPGFGYSEFFQKQFFHLLFKENITHIGAANALQKLPFVPYCYGTSVFKWVTYELNETGDSYFRLFTDNPKPLIYHITKTGDGSLITVLCEGNPVPNAKIYFEESNRCYAADVNGIAFIISADSLENKVFSIYAEGYQTVLDGVLSSTEDVSIVAFYPRDDAWEYYYEYDDRYELRQCGNYHSSVLINNAASEALACHIELLADTTIVHIENSEIETTLAANTIQEYRAPNFSVIYTENTPLLPKGYPLTIQIKLTVNRSGNEEIITRDFVYPLSGPEVCIENLDIESDAVLPGTSVPFTISFTEPIHSPFNISKVTISSDIITFNESHQTIHYNSVSTDSTILRGFIGNFMTIPGNLEDGQIIPIHVIVGDSRGQGYHVEKTLMIPVGKLYYFNDFNQSLDMTGDPEWQRVVAPIAQTGGQANSALSCRPTEYGTYTLASPDFVYREGTQISFDYFYKMPMYGKDGVFIKLVHNTTSEDILFLGSGGALGRVSTSDYITSNWASYELDLANLPLHPLQVGDLFHLEFSFVYADTTGLNNYTEMPDVGVFIDDLKIFNDMTGSQTNVTQPIIRILAYPNPIDQFAFLKIDLLSWTNTTYDLNIYNIRGQRVYHTKGVVEGTKTKRLIWNKVDDRGSKVASGVYLVKIKAAGREVTKKIIIIN